MGTLLNIARCHELSGKTATAWAEYREVVGLAKAAGQQKRAETAEAHAAELEPKLARLRVVAPGLPADGVLQRDGTPVGEAARSVATPVDPGDHTVAASAPGRRPWSTTVKVAAGPGEVTVTVPELDAAAPAPATARYGPARTAGLVLVGVGAAGVVAGGVLGGLTLADAHRASSDATLCPGMVCTPAGRQVISGAETKALASSVSLGVGLAAAAGGAILVATARPLAIAPAAGPGSGGISVLGRF
jgi:hypothetical protein